MLSGGEFSAHCTESVFGQSESYSRGPHRRQGSLGQEFCLALRAAVLPGRYRPSPASHPAWRWGPGCIWIGGPCPRRPSAGGGWPLRAPGRPVPSGKRPPAPAWPAWRESRGLWSMRPTAARPGHRPAGCWATWTAPRRIGSGRGREGTCPGGRA